MTKRRREYLTESEKKQLNDLTLGYGKLVLLSVGCGIETTTLRRIQQNGYGSPEIVQQLRKKVFSKTKSKAIA